MSDRKAVAVSLPAALSLLALVASAAPPGQDSQTWLAAGEKPAGEAAQAQAPPAKAPAEAPAAEAPPLPFHTIEGTGGCCITPMAYLVNPGRPGTVFGLPSASFTYLSAGHKNVESFAVTETFLRRLEFGYAINRFGMGTLRDDVERAAKMDIGHDSLCLHHFNLRAMLVEENSFNLPLPAITAGVHFKYNDAVRSIDNHLRGVLGSIGFARSNGTDFTLTASKTLPDVLGRPLILTAGMRNSQAAQIGYLGFGHSCATTFEGSAVYLPLDWLAVGYEFRQKSNPYDRIPGLVGDEDNWHAVSVGIIYKRMTICAGWANLGNLANSSGDCAWALQLKYEF